MRSADPLPVLAITLLAGITRLFGFNYPAHSIVDEFWYARDGCYYWTGSVERCRLADLVAPDRDVTTWIATFRELTPEHPPLAKWLIGAPMQVLDPAPGVWRLTAVAAGVVTVVLLYLLAKRLFGTRWAASGAAGLLAIDYVHVIHSRLAMLEVFVTLFAVAAFYFCLLDKAQHDRRVIGLPSHWRWRLAAGLAAGAAAASKLSGWAVVIAVLVLVATWEVAAHRRATSGRRRGGELMMTVLLLAIMPVFVYMAAYVGRLEGNPLALPWDDGSWFRAWLDRQVYMAWFHADKPPAATPWWSVPMTEPALSYVLDNTREGVRQILLFANPVLWWAGFIAVGVSLMRLVRGRFATRDGVVIVAFAAGYAGWVSLALTQRPLHLFHAVTVAPFLYLALAGVALLVARSRPGRVAIVSVVASAVIAFTFYLPILAGRPLDAGQWQLRTCSALVLWLSPMDACEPSRVR